MLRVPFRFLEGCLIAAHAIQSQHVFVYIRGEYEREFEVLRDSLEAMRKRGSPRRRHGRAPPRRRRVHLRRGDGAPRVARGQARPAADEAAVPGDRGPVRGADRGEQRRVDHDGDAGARDRRRGVREARRRELDRHARVLALRRRREPRATTSSRTASRMRELIYDVGGGVPERARAEGGHPRRLVDARSSPPTDDRHDARLHLARRGRLLDRLGRRDRDRRPLLHGAARHPRLAVLRARVVREVHAVPRRHEAG